jgi:hypothetical protein
MTVKSPILQCQLIWSVSFIKWILVLYISIYQILTLYKYMMNCGLYNFVMYVWMCKIYSSKRTSAYIKKTFISFENPSENTHSYNKQAVYVNEYGYTCIEKCISCSMMFVSQPTTFQDLRAELLISRGNNLQYAVWTSSRNTDILQKTPINLSVTLYIYTKKIKCYCFFCSNTSVKT